MPNRKTTNLSSVLLACFVFVCSLPGCVKFEPDKTVLIEVTDLIKKAERDEVLEILKTMYDKDAGAKRSESRYSEGLLTVKMYPVSDVEAFSRRINFGTVTEVSGDAVEPSTGTAVVETADEWEGPEDFRFIVRPYTWTQGRTRPVQELALETLVSTSDIARDVATVRSAEHSAIAGLCVDVRSVAEVAALLAVPLGVARVLLADMIDTGLVYVHRNPTEAGSPPGLSLMERVLAGLHQL